LGRLPDVVCVSRDGFWKTFFVNRFPHCSCIGTTDQEWTSSGLSLLNCMVRNLSKLLIWFVARVVPSSTGCATGSDNRSNVIQHKVSPHRTCAHVRHGAVSPPLRPRTVS